MAKNSAEGLAHSTERQLAEHGDKVDESLRTEIQSAIDEGATLVTGGVGRPDGRNAGYYIQPTLFTDVRPDMRIAQEETFGPVAPVVRPNRRSPR